MMTTRATTSFMADAYSPDALVRARRRLLTCAPDSGHQSLGEAQLRELAEQNWTPPAIARLDATTIKAADPVTRALLAESVRESLERDSSQNAPTAPTTTRAQDTTPSLG